MTSRCSSLLPPASADVRPSDDAMAFEGQKSLAEVGSDDRKHGRCPDMCPEWERYERAHEKDWNLPRGATKHNRPAT